jgi:hypothetical protein
LIIAIVIGVFVSLLVFLGFRVNDMLEKATLTPRVPARSLGKPSEEELHLNSTGERQLRTAIMLVMKLLHEPGLLQESTVQLLTRWTLDCRRDSIDKVLLLDNIGRILIVVQTEHNLLVAHAGSPDASLGVELVRELNSWLNDYHAGR